MILDATCNQHDGHLLGLGALQNAIGKFAHQRLPVCRPFTRNDEIGVFQEFIKADGIEQKVDARAACCIHVLQESIAQTSSGSCPRHILTVISEVLGGNGSKPSGAGIELGDHLWRGSFLGCKDGCGTVDW